MNCAAGKGTNLASGINGIHALKSCFTCTSTPVTLNEQPLQIILLTFPSCSINQWYWLLAVKLSK